MKNKLTDRVLLFWPKTNKNKQNKKKMKTVI